MVRWIGASRNVVVVAVVVFVVNVVVFWYMRSTCEWISSSGPCQTVKPNYSAFRYYSGTGDVGVDDVTAETQPVVPVYVVEEHHEVLPYWFKAAERGIIPKKGNVLFHIDAHSDIAPPFLRQLLPLFKWPNSSEIRNMMQGNDQFILPAALTGFISRFIWVWPRWLTAVGFQALDLCMKVQLGTTMRRDVDGKMVKDFCACVSADSEDVTEPWCVIVNGTNERNMKLVDVQKEDCHIQSRNVAEVVSEDKAIELLHRGDWINPYDNVILDIDEDFYGVQSAVQPLYDAGIDKNTLWWLHFFVQKLFCSANVLQERKSDKFYNSVLQKIINFKRFCSEVKPNVTSPCHNGKVTINRLFRLIPGLLQDLKEKDLQSALCTTDERKITITLRALTRHLSKCNEEQLSALSQVGICLKSSANTYAFNPGSGMKICDGYNKPNDSSVPFYMPSEAEIDIRTQSIRDILKVAYMSPKLVTVCRSTRDGYTPRRQFRQIERGILNVLNDHVEGVDKDMVYYDPDLLGGRFGWHNRR